MPLWKWSKTAASNATADSAINWAEGQAPSSVNDSARSMMARIAEYRDDLAGAIVTGGTSTAYTVSSNQVFDTFAHMNNAVIAFTPHTTNGDTVTLNVDSLGAVPLRSAPDTEILAGTLVEGTPYTALYNDTDGAFYLSGYYSSAYNVPFLGGMDYWDTVAPNSAFIFPKGQAISRTTYARAFARWGTTYGGGNGSTTFNVPDKTERVSAMITSAASRLTGTYFGGNSTQMGAVGGLESHGLIENQLPNLSKSVSSVTASTNEAFIGASSATKLWLSLNNPGVGSAFYFPDQRGQGTVPVSGQTVSFGGGNSHNNTQPTIICNYIIRIL